MKYIYLKFCKYTNSAIPVNGDIIFSLVMNIDCYLISCINSYSWAWELPIHS